MGLLPLFALAFVLFPDLRPTLDQRTAEALVWGALPMLGACVFGWAGWQEGRAG